MNKRDARNAALFDNITVGDLRRRISATTAKGMSKVNKSVPHERALEIYTEALRGRDDDEDATVNRRDVLTVTNILRDTVDQ